MKLKQPIYAGPHNEYLEEHNQHNCGQLEGRIMFDGMEVATLSYAEDCDWGELYAKAPDMLAALLEIRRAVYVVGKPKAVRCAVDKTTDLISRFVDRT